jgi:hypothetical protein
MFWIIVAFAIPSILALVAIATAPISEGERDRYRIRPRAR